jgi:hypothetical protein
VLTQRLRRLQELIPMPAEHRAAADHPNEDSHRFDSTIALDPMSVGVTGAAAGRDQTAPVLTFHPASASCRSSGSLH